MDISIEKLRLKNTALGPPIPKTTKALPRHKGKEKFLKGPIPWKWITKAAPLQGRAFQVSMAIWHLAGIKGQRMVALPNKVLSEMGISQRKKSRGLKALSDAGLVSVKQISGRSPLVTIEEV